MKPVLVLYATHEGHTQRIAERVGNFRAVRAVARANGTNRICVLIPCHRVIAKDGNLSGYGGGVWRKRLLLELEKGRVS